ncbi:MAG: fluoride efflux transporter CrcB [Alphaproteobacteria bacterium]|nr:fluoride efflux transporter CrcB [Alphaproteobacteria bacterium]
MKMVLAVAAGGAVGALARYAVMIGVGMMTTTHFPLGTIAVNILGSFVLGALVELSALVISLTPELRAFLVVGVLGAFTTFSTFSMDVVALAGRHDMAQAGLYIAVSVVFGVIAFVGAMRIVRWLVG